MHLDDVLGLTTVSGLTHLSLRSCDQVGSAGAVAIACTLPRLWHLGFSGCRLDSQDVWGVLAACTNLHSLRVMERNLVVDDATLQHLSHAIQLVNLQLAAAAGYTKFDDKSPEVIDLLASMPHLDCIYWCDS